VKAEHLELAKAKKAELFNFMKHIRLSYEELQPDHSLRRFFNTALMNSDVTYSFKELMMDVTRKNAWRCSHNDFL